MTDASRFDMVRRLFDEARSLAPDERRRFLDARCDDDPDLRREVDSLLDLDDDDSALDRPPLPTDAATLVGGSPVAPETLDRYTLGRVLGEGGFGVVYDATQTEPVRRRVALKIIKPGMDSAAVVRRFESERQALAMMDHPGVARVYDGGVTHQGRPFFAMELVDGDPITRFCDRQRLSLRRRIELLIRVCDALQHAHFKGVIHRDLKPANILVAQVDGIASPKIIDFGIAKALDESSTPTADLTMHGQMIGTPEYMSPEQACGQDVDTRSDVYALGIVLYELLTGTSPFAMLTSAESLAEVQRIIRDVEPGRPSTRISALASADCSASAEQVARVRSTEIRSLTNVLRRDLDWIVMRCLEKDRDRRYASAGELAADLRRFLDDQPVLAGPPSHRYRAAKFIRRNRTLVAGTAVVFIALLIGMITTSIGLAWALRAEADAQAAAADAQREAAVSTAINAFLNDDLLGAVDPGRTANREITVREVVDAASERIDDQFRDQPAVEAELRETIATLYSRLGDAARAEPHRRRAIELYTAVYGADDDRTINANHALTSVLLDQRRLDEALEHTLAEVEFLREARDADDVHTLMAVSTLGTIYLMLGRFAEATPILEQSLRDKRSNLGDRDPSTLNSIHNLAGIYLQLDRLEDSVTLYREAFDGRCEVVGRGDPSTIGSSVSLSLALIGTGRFVEAETLLTESLEIARERLDPGHRLILLAMGHLAAVSYRQERYPEAETRYREALAAYREYSSSDNINTIGLMARLADVYLKLDEPDKALELLRECTSRGGVTMPRHWQHAEHLTLLGECLLGRDDIDDAVAALTEASCILDEAFGIADARTRRAVEALKTALIAQGREDAAAEITTAAEHDRLQDVLCQTTG